MADKYYHFYLRLLCFAGSVSLISSAFIITSFDIEPCVLCTIQQQIWALITICSAFSFFKITQTTIKWVMHLSLLLIFFSFTIAFYHTGIEHGLWTLPEALCSMPELSDDAFLNPDFTRPIGPSCKTPFQILPGLSLALINTVLSGSLFCLGLFLSLNINRRTLL